MQDFPDAVPRALIEVAIGEALVADGKLTAAGLDRDLRLRGVGSEPFFALLTRLGLAAERDVAAALSERLGVPLVTPDEIPDAPLLEADLGANFLRHAKVLPISETDDCVQLAMADPLDEVTRRAIALRTKKRVEPRVAALGDIEAAHERLYPAAPAHAADPAAPQAVDPHQDVDRLKDMASGAPVIRLANQIIARAVEMRASDIHIEPREHRLAVRYRIDGALQELDPPP
ncbi:MAG: GspE/PulE family protein, partial [Stellaceae bacterium]